VDGLAPNGPTQTAEVLSVTDGDTIDVLIDGRLETVRYIGIDTPELHPRGGPAEFMADEAAHANTLLVDGQTVHLERDVSQTDRFGRLLRYVWLRTPDGWLMVNRQLVRDGLAKASAYPPDTRWQHILDDAENDAREERLGIWRP
jgi:micrococcal nuclease